MDLLEQVKGKRIIYQTKWNNEGDIDQLLWSFLFKNKGIEE